MEVLKNLLTGLLAGNVGLWALLVISALVVWVVVDAAILARGLPEGFCGKAQESPTSFDLEIHRSWDRSEDKSLGDSTDMSTPFGGLWGHGTNSDGTSRM